MLSMPRSETGDYSDTHGQNRAFYLKKFSILRKHFSMKSAATIRTAFFVFAAAHMTACNNDTTTSYQQYYHPNPSVVFASNPGELKYNPKHGQPGHRHDLPDGAPLPGTAQTSTLSSTDLAKFASAPATNPSQIPGLTVNPSAPTAIPASTGALNPAHGQPGHRCDIAVGAPLSSAPATTSVNTATAPQKLNPAHGQPGHRCDIAVGAPLNSTPAKPATVNSQPATNPSTTPAGVKPKVNPAHGQPFHRCDIAVGAPLDAPSPLKTENKPAGVPVPPLPTTTSVRPDSSLVPLTADSSGNLVRLNPAHGQPGHDCKIPVGKPLKQ